MSAQRRVHVIRYDIHSPFGVGILSANLFDGMEMLLSLMGGHQPFLLLHFEVQLARVFENSLEGYAGTKTNKVKVKEDSRRCFRCEIQLANLPPEAKQLSTTLVEDRHYC